MAVILLDGVYSNNLLTRSMASGGVRGLNTYNTILSLLHNHIPHTLLPITIIHHNLTSLPSSPVADLGGGLGGCSPPS